jgi:hypothetical protein
MALKKLSENQVKNYLEMLVLHGEEGLYRRTISMGIMRYAANVKHPEIDILDLSDAFFVVYKKEEIENYYIIGRVLRRAAHTLYRKLLKSKNNKINTRFLNAIQ